MSTPAIKDGLAYISDAARNVHCIDIKTGQAVWTQKTNGEMWASPLVADGKVYIGTCKGDFWILAAGPEKKVLCHTTLGADQRHRHSRQWRNLYRHHERAVGNWKMKQRSASCPNSGYR